MNVAAISPPAAHPADPRPEGTGGPGEGRTEIRRGVVQFQVAQGHQQQHRNEADQEDRRQLNPDLGHGRDTAGIYTEAGETDRAAAGITEAEIIGAYLPQA
ncbi:uncharacterized protein YqeY [Arthrobacter sp. V4I6]|nr:uncharacterized protein YqeY [Arthrobacter sp. V1I7]MDQ0855667.1 uncharacterized protein YqeY [Arthrobacter sp. V4I6]